MDEEAVSEEEPEEVIQPGTTDTAPLSSDQLQQIDRLQKAADSKGATADTWRDLGNIYFDTDQPGLAIKAYDRALALRPEDTDILNDQGAMYRQTGDFKKALANFERASSADPKNLESLYNQGYVYAFDLNDIPKALIIWKRYLELESKSEAARQIHSFIDQYGKQPLYGH
jgi:tetratricopeptide (TPR) repeat protein